MGTAILGQTLNVMMKKNAITHGANLDQCRRLSATSLKICF